MPLHALIAELRRADERGGTESSSPSLLRALPRHLEDARPLAVLDVTARGTVGRRAPRAPGTEPLAR